MYKHRTIVTTLFVTFDTQLHTYIAHTCLQAVEIQAVPLEKAPGAEGCDGSEICKTTLAGIFDGWPPHLVYSSTGPEGGCPEILLE
jgi:hypothetical protein